MVQLAILSGKAAGSITTARRFPFTVGRAADCDLRTEEQGVWDRHAVLRLEHGKGFVAHAESEALLSVNGQSGERFQLRNGDILELGAARLRFWISPPRLRSLAVPEAGLWIVVAGVTLGQVALIYLLLR